MASHRFFGTDGVRGRVGEEPITPQSILKLGWAAGCVFRKASEGAAPRNAKVIIGKDTRVSGYLLESALESGFSAAGVDVALLGPMPTPAIAYLARTARADAGVVISASHNPYYDNGIKFFSTQGAKLDDDIERAIEEQMAKPMTVVAAEKLGKATRFADAAGRYIEFCKSTVEPKLTFQGIKLVVDCANGAGYHIAPNVYAELGADVASIAAEPNGFNINDGCGSTQTAGLQEAVVREEADLGVALDGDGDRVILVDGNGDVVDGDKSLFILARERRQNGAMSGGVVGTLMTNLGLEHALANLGIEFTRARVGDRHVMSCMTEKGWELGGETSGHIICLDKCTTGDGIVASLQVIQAMVRTRRSLADLTGGMSVYPQTMLNVPVPGSNGSGGFNAFENKSIRSAIREAENILGHNGRVVLRPSGTEPVIRVMVEGVDAELVKRLGARLAEVVRAETTP
ncbi:MAG: Phosphoglucosamine mutase [Gammaproteobacteria bacterium]|nr:Phosphoglucosamine mutase [Gammaproteobacteria bacterium]